MGGVGVGFCMGGCVSDPDAKPGPMTSVLCRWGGVMCGSGSLSEDESDGKLEDEDEGEGACRVGGRSPYGSY